MLPLRARLALGLGALLLVLAPAIAAAATPDTIAISSIERKSWPEVTVRVVLPAEMLRGGALASRDFSLTENGAHITELTAVPVPADTRALDVLLVFDTSRSMEGTRLSEAKAAAQLLLEELGPRDRVGLIAFDSRSSVVESFTTDRGRLASAIEGLQAGQATAMYDAVALAVESFGGRGSGDRAIVLLSDGGDTESGHALGDVVAKLERGSAPVYAVALGDDESGISALRAIARESGGRLVSVRDEAELGKTFSGIARQLTSPYDITYTSLRPPSKDLELVLTASSGTGRANVSFVLANPDTLNVSEPEETPARTPGSFWPPLITVLVFLAVGAFALAILILMRPEPNAIAQLRYFEQMRAAGGRTGVGSHDLDPESMRGRVVELAGVVASKGGFDAAIRQSLERAGLPLRPVEYMVLHSSTVLLVSILIQLVGQSMPITIITIVLLAFGPVVMLQILADSRSRAFQEQLPDVLNLLASSLRAGWGLQQAVSVVVSELGPPAALEFERVVTEARLGLPLEDALEKMAVRMNSEDFKWAVTAIAIQREVGGNLAEVLDMVASTIRERAMLRRQISSLTAEGRLSAIILIALPFVEGGALWMLNPGYFAPLVGSPYGLVTMSIGLVLLVIGMIWLRNVVKIEV